MKELLQDFSNILVQMEIYQKYVDLPPNNKNHVIMIEMAGEYYEIMSKEKEITGENTYRGLLLKDLMNYMIRFQDVIENHSPQEFQELLKEMKQQFTLQSVKQKQLELTSDILQSDLQSMKLINKKIEASQNLVNLELEYFERITERTEKVLESFHMEVVDGTVREKLAEYIDTEGSLYSITDLEMFTEIHEARIKSLIKENGKNTLVINAYGGPGAGKTTSCLSLVAELKKRGYTVEYVSEYAKELVYDDVTMLDGSKENQLKILGEQIKRIDRYMGKVDFVVTDASILLNSVYLKDEVPGYEAAIAKLYNHYKNFNYFVNRGEKFEQEGRVENLEQSIEKDEEIKTILKNNQIFYGIYTHETIENLADKVLITHGRITPAKERPKTFKAIAYMKEKTDTPMILYGNNAEELIRKLQLHNQEQDQEKQFVTCYLRMYHQESGSYENNRKFDLTTGKDITPIYLNIPHMKKEQFLEVVKQIKQDGAKYNPIKKSFYVTKENDLNRFSEYLPLPGTFGQDKEGRPRKELQVDVNKNGIKNELEISIEGMEAFQVTGREHNVDFFKMTEEEAKEFATQYILPEYSCLEGAKNAYNTQEAPFIDEGNKISIMDKIKENKGKLEEYGGRKNMEYEKECR